MNIMSTAIPEVKIIEPKVFGDNRGFFYETFSVKRYEEALGVSYRFVQDNLSRSEKGVLRGLHHQADFTQGKLVSVLNGSVFDVAVDIRVGSPTFGQSVGVELNSENRYQLWVPPGFAHGFIVLSDYADFYYKCTNYYHPQSEISLIWNDPDLAIDWPLEENKKPSLSQKDINAKTLKTLIDEQTLPLYEDWR